MIVAAVNAVAAVDDGILDAPTFDPASASVEFQLDMADLAEIVFLPRLLSHLQRVAPQASVRSESLSRYPKSCCIGRSPVVLSIWLSDIFPNSPHRCTSNNGFTSTRSPASCAAAIRWKMGG
jgi:hypothetical protein